MIDFEQGQMARVIVKRPELFPHEAMCIAEINRAYGSGDTECFFCWELK